MMGTVGIQIGFISEIAIDSNCEMEFRMPDVYQADTPSIRDAPPTSPTMPTEDVRTMMLSRISWGAVFAGVVVALATNSCSTSSEWALVLPR